MANVTKDDFQKFVHLGFAGEFRDSGLGDSEGLGQRPAVK